MCGMVKPQPLFEKLLYYINMKGLIKMKNVNETKNLNVIEAYRLWREAQDLMEVIATGRVYNMDLL